MKRLSLFLVLIAVAAASLRAQWHSIGNADSVRMADGRTLELRAGTTGVRITILADDLVRIQADQQGTPPSGSSVAVEKTDWPEILPSAMLTGDSAVLSTSQITVVVTKSPVRITVRKQDGTVLCQDDERGMAWDGANIRVWKKRQAGEQFFGLGEKTGALNRTGKAFAMWNSDIPAYKADTDPLYESIPFFYSLRHGAVYGIYFDDTYRTSFDLGVESPDAYSFGATGGAIDYYVFAGQTPRQILGRFTELVGRMPMPPRWALGYQQCRWSYSPESKVRAIARTFRQKKIPCDVIYLDIDYMDGYRVFTWSPKNFPEPKKLLADLAAEGFKVVTIIDPGIKADSAYHAFQTGLADNAFLKYPDGRLYLGKVWPGICAFPDFTDAAARAWWGANFSVLIDAGVRGFWNDMNEPSVFDVPSKTIDLDVVHNDDGRRTSHAANHNIYGLQMTRATYDGVRALRPEERPFILTRASFAGGQRYAAAWTGDNVSSWEHLQLAVPMCLGLSISGQPFVGTDIGGFIGAPDGELFARWLQLGVFTPLMRAHSVINSPDKEPWAFGPVYEAVNRSTIELRYRLLPYIYNAMHRASITGIPPMRPLIFDFPNDDAYLMDETDFLFGDDLLVAPVLWPGQRTQDVRLPAGTWYDYWTDREFRGGANVTVEAPIDRVPFFVKAGAILPTQQPMQYVDQAPVSPLTLTVYPADSSSTTYYGDDGISFGYRKGQYSERTITQQRSAARVVLTFTASEGSYPVPRRYVDVRFLHVAEAPASVAIEGKVLARLGKTDGGEGWWFDGKKHLLGVRMTDRAEAFTVSATFASSDAGGVRRR